MSDSGMPKQWTDEQWSRVQQVVHDQALKARVAARFLPLFGPLPRGTKTVPKQLLSEGTKGQAENRESQIERWKNKFEELEITITQITIGLNTLSVQIAQANDDKIKSSLQNQQTEGFTNLGKANKDRNNAIEQLVKLHQDQPSSTLTIDDSNTLELITVAINVPLSNTQQSEPDLSSALTLFARAANVIARTEDGIIFKGEDPGILIGCEVNPKPDGIGLLNASQNLVDVPSGINGRELVERVADGIGKLDDQGYLPPYALVLGEELFRTSQTPDSNSLVLPSDRIRPLIEGPLYRSGALPKNKGVLVSLSANPVEIVIGSDIHVRFLQLTPEGRYLYRVSQRFVLRIKEPNAIVTFEPAEGSPSIWGSPPIVSSPPAVGSPPL